MPSSKCYLFTHFKMPELYEKWGKLLSELPYFRYLICQVEACPTSEKLHIQGYIEFIKITPLKVVRNVLPSIHLERRRGKQSQAIEYCSKKETRVLEPIEIGTPLDVEESQQGRRTDLMWIKNQVLKRRSLRDILISTRCTSFQQIRFAEKLMEHYSTSRDIKIPPKVYWYWGATGTGKTAAVYEKYNKNEIYSSFAYRWWNKYHQQKVILIDDFRKDYCKFHILLKLLDRYPHIVEVKGGTVEINSEFIIITCPEHPEVVYQTREDVQQLLRRINVIRKFIKKVNKYDFEAKKIMIKND